MREGATRYRARSCTPGGRWNGSFADGPLPTSRFLERLSRRLGAPLARDEDVLSNTLQASGNAIASPEGRGVAGLREVTRVPLRDALRTGEHEAVPDAEVRKMLRTVLRSRAGLRYAAGAAAHPPQGGMAPLPETREQTHAEAHARLARVVTLCIEEYFEEPPSSR